MQKEPLNTKVVDTLSVNQLNIFMLSIYSSLGEGVITEMELEQHNGNLKLNPELVKKFKQVARLAKEINDRYNSKFDFGTVELINKKLIRIDNIARYANALDNEPLAMLEEVAEMFYKQRIADLENIPAKTKETTLEKYFKKIKTMFYGK